MRKTITILILILFINIILVFSGGQQQKSLKEIYKTGKVQFLEEMKISDYSMPEDVPIKFLGDLVEDKNGNIFVLDGGTHKVLKLSSKGKLIKVIGQQGQGPGDLYGPAYINIHGKYISVYEYGNVRFSIFNFEGEFIKIVKVKSFGSSGFIYKPRSLPNGDYAIEKQKAHKVGNNPYEMYLDIYSPVFEYKKRLYSKKFVRFKYVNNNRIPVPFYRKVVWNICPDGNIVIGFSEKFEIEIHDPSSDKVNIISHKFKPKKVTEEEKKNYFKGWIWGGKRIKEPPNSVKKYAVFPKYKPAFNQIVVDLDGNILVFPEEESSFFYAFDSSGIFLERVEILGKRIPTRNIVPARNNCFWIFETDHSYNQYVKKYKIVN